MRGSCAKGPSVLTESANAIAGSSSILAEVAMLGAVAVGGMVVSGAIAYPAARVLGVPRLFACSHRSEPAQVAATLVACASIARERGFNAAASAGRDPMLARAIHLAASDVPADQIRRELLESPTLVPRQIVILGPVLGLLSALAGLGGIMTASSVGLVTGPWLGAALVLALFAAFILSAVASAAADRTDRLTPADVLSRTLMAAAAPAIRAGADAREVEQILRPLLAPTNESFAGRLAA
jgi:flagellar motor component MotA